MVVPGVGEGAFDEGEEAAGGKGAKLIRACISRAGKLTENVPDYFRTGAVVPATIELAAR